MAYTQQDIQALREGVPEEFAADPAAAGITANEFSSLAGGSEIAIDEDLSSDRVAFADNLNDGVESQAGNEARDDRNRMRTDTSQTMTAIHFSVSIAGMSYTLNELEQTTDDILDNWQDYKAYLKSQGYSDRQIAQAKEHFLGLQHADTRAEKQQHAEQLSKDSAAQSVIQKENASMSANLAEESALSSKTDVPTNSEEAEEILESGLSKKGALGNNTTDIEKSSQQSTTASNVDGDLPMNTSASHYEQSLAHDQTDFPHVSRISDYFCKQASGQSEELPEEPDDRTKLENQFANKSNGPEANAETNGLDFG